MVEASRRIGGETLGLAMLLASLVANASLCNSTILYTTRIPAAMAQDGYLPRWLGRLHPKFGTPAGAMAVCLAVGCLLSRFRVVDLVNIYIWARIATSKCPMRPDNFESRAATPACSARSFSRRFSAA